jgi:3-hydroxyisobutyrate dehydrogenase-like beta-hydroxyacid dehydrogenase
MNIFGKYIVCTGSVRRGELDMPGTLPSAQAEPKSVVGIIGLGIMGSAFARNLLSNGFTVLCYDPVPQAGEALRAAGGQPMTSPRAVAEAADHVLIVLASIPALHSVIAGEGGMAPALRAGQVLAEMGTLPLDAKEAARNLVAATGATLLDCPVSGTGAQAALGDLVVFASGPAEAVETMRPIFGGFARDVRHVGDFGAGMKLKLVANLLVSNHNLATAEALLLAERSGLDLQMTYDAIAAGAGTSRMFEVRGPMMVAGRYEPATMKMDVYQKDLALIMDHAAHVGCPSH